MDHAHRFPRGTGLRRRHLLLGLLAAPLVQAADRAGIRIVYSEAQPDPAAPLRKLLVLGLSTRQDLRRLFEDAVAQGLRGLGVQATAAHSLLPAGKPPERAAITRLVKEAGYDGVLVSRLIATERGEIAAPAAATHFVPTLDGSLAQLDAPAGEADGVLVAVTETSIYRVADGQRAWSALTDVHNPKDLAQTTQDFARVMLADLRAKRVL